MSGVDDDEDVVDAGDEDESGRSQSCADFEVPFVSGFDAGWSEGQAVEASWLFCCCV